MKFKVHRLELKGAWASNAAELLEHFLESLEGEVVSIIPIVVPVFMGYGGGARTAAILVTTRIG